METLKTPNFRTDNKVYVVKCQQCNHENYPPNVMSGFCTWCGEDHNQYLSQNKERK